MAAGLFGLAGRNALVVGAGAGMGEQACVRLAEAGCAIAAVDLSAERADAVAGRLEALGVRAVPIVGDAVDPDGALQIVAAADTALGGLDVVVTIVGGSAWAPLVDMPLETWERDQALNLRHVFLLFREAARTMIAAGRVGAMTCVSSVSGVQSAPNHGAYGAAKAGLIQLVRTMAVEWADAGIRVNSVGPGSIVTPRVPDTPERVANLRDSRVPMRRRGTVDDIAKAILFLSSDMAEYVTGQNLMVDGGWTAANLKNRAGVIGP